ncbi:Zinc finger RING-type [Arabidopsis thaliana x Arabidopsis arenosa]|uniref:Zinc finger RING-type n=1 Tax=Arabidopsis thaliana x Arabidopsis arenosa TaxID=1240361 RepID=A0A8T1Y4R3_9BRAS|nr:Zinc finger RING-type [Arabidopsis thaliana x Arabidopsis arenosa]
MEMASSEVDMSSCQTFNCVLSRPHERCTQRDNNNTNKKKNNNNVRNIHVAAFEKNLNVFVRDHLENCSVSIADDVDDCTKTVPEGSSSNKSSVSDQRFSKTEESVPSSSSSLGSDQDSNSGQPENPSRAASSLVQIWEARTTQQPPSSNQSLIDSRTSSMGSNALENSESLESVKESEMIQPIEEGNNEEEEEEIECVSQSVPPPPDSGEKDREGVRVMDIIRKLSNDSETMTNNENGSSSNDNSKEVQTTEARSFPQVACSPRIRGRQALADLLVQMTRDREKELACLRERHCVSKFTNRGRIQSTLRIRCYERCIAIQGRHRSKSTSAGSDSNRSSRGSGVMHLLREKYKGNSENIETGASTSNVSTRGRIMDKDPQKATEKKVLQETIEKSGLKEVVSAVENAKKVVLSETSKNKSSLKKPEGETIQKETADRRGEKRETKEKVVSKESVEGKGEKQELTTEKAIAKESVEGKALVGIAEKVNLWNSEEIMNRRKVVEKGKTIGKANTERVEKNDVLEEATRRISNVESAERSITTTSKETMTRCEFTEKVVKGNKKEDCVSLQSKSKETEDRNIKPQGVTIQADSCSRKPALEENVLEKTTTKTDLRKPIEKESREERREIEESVEENTLMGIAEKVNLWNSKEKKNRRRAMEKGKGKTEGKANTETNEVLQEASRRISNVETAERSIATSMETVEKVVGNKVMMDKRESSGETTRFAEKGGQKKEEDLASVEAKSKEIIEDKNMNPQSASHGSRERDKEKNSSQHGEETSIPRNSETKSTKEIVRHNSQEVIQEEQSVTRGSRERDKVQHGENMLFLRNSEANKSTKEVERKNYQEVSQEEDSASQGSRERAKEKNSSQQDDETSILRNPNGQNGIKESEDEETKKVEREEENAEAAVECINDSDENEMEEEEEEYGDYYDHFIGDDDWIHDISRPRSYWEDLRKERYLEVLNTESEKKDICNLIERRTVSNFLTSDLRQKIDNLMITRVQSHIGVPLNQIEEGDEDEEEWEVECSARNQEDNETEEEPEKTNLEAASDVCSQSSARSSTMMSWTFRDQDIDKDNEPTTSSLSLPEPLVPTNQSTQDMQTISDLRSQMEQLQREMLELRNSVKSCIDMQLHFQKSVTQDLSRSGSSAEERVDTKKDPLKRKCCVCSEMPVDSLLYRCGHMCTCLKCAHELQWSSKKCPICMAPIVDVVRAFLDS